MHTPLGPGRNHLWVATQSSTKVSSRSPKQNAKQARTVSLGSHSPHSELKRARTRRSYSHRIQSVVYVFIMSTAQGKRASAAALTICDDLCPVAWNKSDREPLNSARETGPLLLLALRCKYSHFVHIYTNHYLQQRRCATVRTLQQSLCTRY